MATANISNAQAFAYIRNARNNLENWNNRDIGAAVGRIILSLKELIIELQRARRDCQRSRDDAYRWGGSYLPDAVTFNAQMSDIIEWHLLRLQIDAADARISCMDSGRVRLKDVQEELQVRYWDYDGNFQSPSRGTDPTTISDPEDPEEQKAWEKLKDQSEKLQLLYGTLQLIHEKLLNLCKQWKYRY